MKRQLLVLLLAMGILMVGCATNRGIERTTAYEYPLRWPVYLLHPVGWAMDVAFMGPVTGIACSMPEVTGCTPNDELGIQR
ncbi:MAG: hypothetical protein ACE5K9_03920 [Candidatus Methylomirabilales bacterium]